MVNKPDVICENKIFTFYNFLNPYRGSRDKQVYLPYKNSCHSKVYPYYPMEHRKVEQDNQT